MDVGFRGSAVAVGAAVFNARVAAARATASLGPVEFTRADGAAAPLKAVVDLTGEPTTTPWPRSTPAVDRETNRHHGTPSTLAADDGEPH